MADEAAAKMRVTLDLFETGVQIREQRFRRDHPDASEAEVRAFIRRWLRERPGADHGDAEGRPVSWPRPS